jgi:hypothetical protein
MQSNLEIFESTLPNCKMQKTRIQTGMRVALREVKQWISNGTKN